MAPSTGARHLQSAWGPSRPVTHLANASQPSVPGDHEPQRLRGDQHQSTPERGRMQAAARAEIPDRQRHDEQVDPGEVGRRSEPVDDRNARHRGRQDRPRSRAPSSACGLADRDDWRGRSRRRRETGPFRRSARQGTGAEARAPRRSLRAARRDERADRSQNHHRHGKHSTEDAQSPVQVQPPTCHQARLGEQQDDPCRVHDAVHRKERLRRRRMSGEERAQVEPTREAHEDDREDRERHPVKKRRSDRRSAFAVGVVTVAPSGILSMVGQASALRTIPAPCVPEQTFDDPRGRRQLSRPVDGNGRGRWFPSARTKCV